MGSPSPPAPIKAARVAVPTLMTALVLIPAMIAGEAMGRRTRKSFAAPESPIASAASASGEGMVVSRSEEHTSELQSLAYLVCRLLLEKKKKMQECV